MNTSKPSIHLRAIEPEDLDLLYRIENDVKLWNVGATIPLTISMRIVR